MSVITGIDLGTCFSAVGQFSDSGEPLIVHNDEGANITPSVVWVDTADGKFHVGEEARKEWNRKPGIATAARFKRWMGRETRVELVDDSYSARDLSTIVLKKLVLDTTARLGSMGNSVVTIPANFDHPARVDTMSAAEHAGISLASDASLPNEPTAAALYYAFKERGRLNGRYAVYDLGGGTFDITILRVDGYRMEILGTGGIRELGGDDFDGCLLALVLKKLNASSPSELTKKEFTLGDAEDMKIALSKRTSFDRDVHGVSVNVTRQEFEEAIASRVQQAEMLCEAILDEAGVTPSQLDGILLAGGSTRIPCIRESIKRVFGREPDTSVNPDEVVALGAAVYSALKTDESSMTALQRRAIGGVALKEICGHYFGTIALSIPDEGRGPEEENCVLITKDTHVPCAITQSYFTVSQGQTRVLCRITECDRADEKDPQFVTMLASGELELPAGRPAGQEIEVTYSIDENMKMHCEYKDVASGKVHQLDLDVSPATESSREAPATIDRFLVE